MSSVLNLSGVGILDEKDAFDQSEFFKPPFQAVGDYLSQAMVADAAEHFELPGVPESPQLELFK